MTTHRVNPRPHNHTLFKVALLLHYAGFEQTADEEGWLGRDESPLWQRWDGINWVPCKIYIKPARLVTCGSAIKLHSLNPHATTAKLNGWAGTTLPQSGFECVAGLRDWSQQTGR
jgi:hypothetical protein